MDCAVINLDYKAEYGFSGGPVTLLIRIYLSYNIERLLIWYIRFKILIILLDLYRPVRLANFEGKVFNFCKISKAVIKQFFIICKRVIIIS